MLISGIQKFTMLDYPDKIACIVFTPGCNFRCGYCHNPEFVLPEMLEKIKSSFVPEETFFNFLEKRKDFLDGVVITGGEPTIMPDLTDFIKKIKDLGFLIKLDTNGSNFAVLNRLLKSGLLDYVAMDIKTSLDKYQELVGSGVDREQIEQSVNILKKSDVPYEFRSTILKETHPDEALAGIAELVNGAEKLYLQTFRPDHVLDPGFETYHAFSALEMEEKVDFFKDYVDIVEVR